MQQTQAKVLQKRPSALPNTVFGTRVTMLLVPTVLLVPLLVGLFLLNPFTSRAKDSHPVSVLFSEHLLQNSGPLVHHHTYSNKEASAFQCRPDYFPPGAWLEQKPRLSDSAAIDNPNAAAPVADTGLELFGTSYTQMVIYRHQHPRSCKEKKFLVHTPNKGGLANQLHVMGAALAIALSLDRVYVLAYSTRTFYTKGEWCEKGDSLDTCFFERFSRCTARDAGYEPELPEKTPEYDPGRDQSRERTIVLHGNAFNGTKTFSVSRLVPPQFEELLHLSRIDTKNKQVYWWRAQAAAYMVRPNERTLEEVRRLKGTRFKGQHIEPGTISVHVRHGKKWEEAGRLSDAALYFDKAKDLYAASAGRLQKRIYLTTEDEAAVQAFKQMVAGTGWTLQYTKTPRKEDYNQTMLDFAAYVGPSTQVLFSLTNLDLALSCDAWVGTLGTSHWCRLMDELRSTVRCKANDVYLDALQIYPYQSTGWR